jgi:phosphoserine phosphatase RsbU/P
VTPSTCRRILRLRAVSSLLFAAACVCAPLHAHTLHAQAFDATNLNEPIKIGTEGVTQFGDDPAWSRTDFDDSKWLPVDGKIRLRDYFPGKHADIVWRRLHIRVSPQQTHLALQAYSISQAFEVYVNGQKLIVSGRVEPYVAYTRKARLIVRIPPEQLRTGSLTIAIRARAPRTWWTSLAPAFNGPMLTLGYETSLRNQSLLRGIGESAATFLENLLAFDVGLVALALFSSQRQRTEYFWIFVLGMANIAFLPLLYVSFSRNIPASVWAFNECMEYLIFLSILLTVQAFLRKPFGWIIWLGSLLAVLVATACDLAFLYGILPATFNGFVQAPEAIVGGVVLPILVVRQLRRGDHEAGILLIPILSYSLYLYAVVGLSSLLLVPALTQTAANGLQRIGAFPTGILSIGLGDVGVFSFYLSLAIIIVLRATRMSREQAVLEGEIAAAAEVQQIIVPEQAENIPGFAIESVYQPARQVGGDFFQILPSPNGGLFLVVGDVAGKGLPAAMQVSVLVGAIRTAAVYSQSPSEVLAQLNQRLVGRTHGGFSTALAAHIAPDGLVTIANAGHLSPYLDGHEIELPGAVPLGIESDITYEATQFLLPQGSRLTFYSDGVVEAQNPQGELFGFERAQAISTQPAATIAEAAKQFGQSDDITVVTIEHLAPLAHPAAIPTAPILVPA